MFDINPNMRIELKTIGNEKTIILIVDDFFNDYSLAVAEAQQANYSSHKDAVGAFYPGIRAPLQKDYGLPILKFASHKMHQALSLDKHMQVLPINANYSLLTKQTKDMSLEQCIPHFDTSEAHCFAALHYMNPGEFGGTAFYRHRPTGFENITQKREPDYFASMQQVFDTKGPPKQQYFSESDHHYELIEKVDYRPNRLVAYPTSILHSAYIDNPQRDIKQDPAIGRLSSNFLFKFQLKQH